MKNLLLWYSILTVIIIQIIILNPPDISGQESNPLIEQDKCISCHLGMELMPEDYHENDIHLQAGLSCAGCHGGDPTTEDPEEAMDPDKGFIGSPHYQDIPKFCGKCHSNITIMRKFQPRISTDQVQQFYTSVHGEKLRQGDKKVAECISCHTAHAIMPANDPRSSTYAPTIPQTCNKCHGDPEYMKAYHIPTDQFDNYVKSVHGHALLEKEDTSAPACNDCHGNHGATPPGLASISHVCGSCHVYNMQYFESSAMSDPFKELDIHACEQCHGYHDVSETNDNMTGVGEESVCTPCHSSGDAGYEAAVKIHKDLTELSNQYDTAQVKLKDVQQKGMDDVEILFLLQEAHQTLIHTRTLVHTFDSDKINEEKNKGIQKTTASIAMANQEIKDFYFRRRGFGIATIFITILVIAIFFKIREMERKK